MAVELPMKTWIDCLEAGQLYMLGEYVARKGSQDDD